MAEFLKPLGLAALIALAAPAVAQDTGGDAAGADAAGADTEVAAPDGTPLDMGTDTGADAAAAQAAPAPVETYVDEVFDAWSRECIRLPEGQEGPDPCQLTQLLHQPGGDNTVGKITIGRLPEGGQAVAGSMIILPLGTLLTEQLLVGIDSAAPRRYPFRFCDRVGCVAQIGLTDGEIAAFKAGNEAKISIASIGDPENKVTIPVSLKGFTAAWDSLAQGATAPAEEEAPAAE